MGVRDKGVSPLNGTLNDSILLLPVALEAQSVQGVSRGIFAEASHFLREMFSQTD